MRKPLCIWFLLLLSFVAVESCVHFRGKTTAPSTARPRLRPKRPPGPRFDHASHMGRGLECQDCHGEGDRQWKAMPSLEVCNQCHGELDDDLPPEKQAGPFFVDGVDRFGHLARLDSEVLFSHGSHVERDADCSTCHGDVAASKEIDEAVEVDMTACMTCHAQKAPQANECASCHTVLRREVAPPSHDSEFSRKHGVELGWSTGMPLREDCALCHTESSCTRCHEQSRPVSHVRGWMVGHGQTARWGDFDHLPTDCSLCHTRSACDACHRAEKPQDHTNLFRLRGHATLASIDRDRCSMCHQRDSCDECHANARPQNHRASWGGSLNRHCVSCHLPLEHGEQDGCAVCHRTDPSHQMAPPRPGNPAHMTTDPASCRECHTPPPHLDNGDSCLLCHR